MNITKQQYNHYGECLVADNGTVKAIFTLELGIRIINFSYIDGENVFFEQPAELNNALVNESGWRVHGGARLWASPESDANYYPDNEPITYTVQGNTVTVTQKTDPFTGLEKSIAVTFPENGTELSITHTIKNNNDSARRYALWALTVMRAGGKQVVDFPVFNEDPFTPTQIIRLWEYTNPWDERIRMSREQFTVNHSDIDANQKLGFINYNGKVTYENNGVRFTRMFDKYDPSLEYSDGGINYETYMCKYMNELEVLSPLYDVESGESVCMNEKWTLEKC